MTFDYKVGNLYVLRGGLVMACVRITEVPRLAQLQVVSGEYRAFSEDSASMMNCNDRGALCFWGSDVECSDYPELGVVREIEK